MKEKRLKNLLLPEHRHHRSLHTDGPPPSTSASFHSMMTPSNSRTINTIPESSSSASSSPRVQSKVPPKQHATPSPRSHRHQTKSEPKCPSAPRASPELPQKNNSGGGGKSSHRKKSPSSSSSSISSNDPALRRGNSDSSLERFERGEGMIVVTKVPLVDSLKHMRPISKSFNRDLRQRQKEAEQAAGRKG
jgi:hypothetical protein